MKCARCQRFISKPAATVTADSGSLNYGPRCAEVAGLLPARARTGRTVTRYRRKNDKQMELLA